MNIGGGEAADQLVRMMLTGTEVAVRLSGSALKNVLALTLAASQNNKKISGKVNLGRMLQDTRDIRRFPMTKQQYDLFRKAAKKYKILYSTIQDKDGKGKLFDVIMPATELERANLVFDRILYTLPPELEKKREKPLQKGHEVFQPERQEPQKEKAVSEPEKGRQEQQKPHPKVTLRPVEQERQEAPVAGQQADTPKKDSRSEQDLPVIKISSSLRSEKGVSRTTNERPSVEQRLKVYRAQARKQSVPAKVVEKAKVMPKTR